MKEFRYEKIDMTSYQMALDNDFKVIVTPTKSDKVTIAINVGKGTYLQDEFRIGNQLIARGTASYLQHSLLNCPAEEAKPLFEKGVKNVSKAYESYTLYAFETKKDKYLDLIHPLMALVNRFELDNDNIEKIKKDYVELAEKEMKKGYVQERNALFVDSPLKENLYGDEKTIKTIHINTLKKFFNEYYRPENLTLLVTGNVDQAKIEEKVREFNFSRPIAKRETVTFAPVNENFDALNDMRVLYNKKKNVVNLCIKFQKRETLVNDFGGYIFANYYLLKDLLFTFDNSQFASICKHCEDVTDVKVYEASEETYLSAKFKATDVDALTTELKQFLNLGKKMIKMSEFRRLRKQGYLRLKKDTEDSTKYLYSVANALANSYLYLTVLNFAKKLQLKKAHKFATRLSSFKKVIY